MKNRLNVLIAAAVLLFAANIIKWTAFSGSNPKKDGTQKTINSIIVNCQQTGGKGQEKTAKNIFFSADNNDYGAAGSGMYAGNTGRTPGKTVPTVVPEKVWPLFRITGVAVNNGKKCAFFSGPVFSGAVYEGNDINDNYSLPAINGNKAEIMDKITSEKKTYTMEVK